MLTTVWSTGQHLPVSEKQQQRGQQLQSLLSADTVASIRDKFFLIYDVESTKNSDALLHRAVFYCF